MYGARVIAITLNGRGGTLNFMAPYGGSLTTLDPTITSRYQDYLVAMNIHPETACREIKRSVKESLLSLSGQHVLELPKYFEVEVSLFDFKTAFQASFYPGAKLLAPEKIGFETGSFMEVLRLQLFITATSLGGVESLVEHRYSIESADSPIPKNLVRLSIGAEVVDDLIADLEQALA